MDLARFSWPGRKELRKASHEQYIITNTTVNIFSHFKIEIEKVTINSIFWTSDPISMTKRQKLLHLFNFYLLFLRKYKELLVHEGRGNGYGPEIHFLLSRYQAFVFNRKHNGRPKNKLKKIKRWGHFQETIQ